jgi:hypothetical protein
MKFINAIASVVGLSLAFSGCARTRANSANTPAASKPAAPETRAPEASAAPALTPDQVGIRAIQAILREQPMDSLFRFFDDSVRANLTPENIDQISWLPRFIGDTLELFMTGTQIMDSTGRTAFFREYRFANESNRRAPLMIVHLFFADSTSPLIAGAYNKVFDNDTKNRIADAQVWKTPQGEIDVHSVSYVEFQEGVLPVMRVYDDFDTTSFDSAYAVAKAAPIIREAIARGFVKTIQAAKPGTKVVDRFGVAFIRQDPRRGYTQYSFALSPEEYLPKDAATKKSAPKKAAKKK